MSADDRSTSTVGVRQAALEDLGSNVDVAITDDESTAVFFDVDLVEQNEEAWIVVDIDDVLALDGWSR